MSRRITLTLMAVCATGSLIGLGAAGVGARPTAAGKADSGTVYLSTNRVVGKVGYASATVTDRLLGSGAVTSKYTLTPQKDGSLKLVSKRTVLFTGTGSLEGTLSATVTVAGTTETFKNGKLDLSTGAGSQKGHTLVGTFSGTGNSTSNEYKLTYKGTYK